MSIICDDCGTPLEYSGYKNVWNCPKCGYGIVIDEENTGGLFSY